MLRRTPMPRGQGFKRKAPHPPPAALEDAVTVMARTGAGLAQTLVLRRGVYTPVADTPAPAVPKHPEYRDTGLRMAIASLPCLHCGRPSQCAHANTPPFGKGGSVKAQDWAGFPLCPDGPGYVGCHTRHDQYMAGLSKTERIDCEAMLICRTLGMLIERGLLTVNLKALP